MTRLHMIALAGVLACSCTRGADATGPTGDACIANAIFSTTFALGVNQTAVDGTNAGLTLAQSFLTPGSVSTTISVNSVGLALYTAGTVPGGTLTIKIRQDSVTPGSPGIVVPSATILVTANTAVTATTPGFVTFNFDSSIQLTGGTTYWLTLAAQYATNATNLVKWAADDVSAGNTATYANGLAKFEIPVPPALAADTFSVGNLGTGRELGFQIFCD